MIVKRDVIVVDAMPENKPNRSGGRFSAGSPKRNKFSNAVSTNLVAVLRRNFSEEVEDANWHDRVGAHGRQYG
jgi:hypothetical protein